MNAVIWGAGREGRGFLAPLFQVCAAITLVDSDTELIRRLNTAGSYVLRQHPVGAPFYEEEISGYRAYVAGSEDSLATVVAADVIALCLYPHDFPAAAKDLALGLRRRRHASPGRNLDLLICANAVHFAPELRGMLSRYLDGDCLAWMDERVGLVETMARRSCVIPQSAGEDADPLVVATNVFPSLLVNGRDTKIDYSGCPNIEIAEDMRMEERRKLYIYNLAHAVYAYVGIYKGHAFMRQSQEDMEIDGIARRAIRQSGRALQEEYGLAGTEMDRYEQTMVRFVTGSRLPDSLARIGFDPARKLGCDERIIGPARMCIARGIDPEAIVATAAHAFLFDARGDVSAGALREHVARAGIRDAVTKYCNLPRDAELTDRIVAEYHRIAR